MGMALRNGTVLPLFRNLGLASSGEWCLGKTEFCVDCESGIYARRDEISRCSSTKCRKPLCSYCASTTKRRCDICHQVWCDDEFCMGICDIPKCFVCKLRFCDACMGEERVWRCWCDRWCHALCANLDIGNSDCGCPGEGPCCVAPGWATCLTCGHRACNECQEENWECSPDQWNVFPYCSKTCSKMHRRLSRK